MSPRNRLLASVADLAEMEMARLGGADIVDLKQPAFGALGAWSEESLTAAVALWNGWGPSRPLISATAGDQPMVPAILREAAQTIARTGVPMVKVGLFDSPHAGACVEALAPLAAGHRMIAVLFADQRPDVALLPLLGRAGFAGVMLDTADKKQGPLTRHLDLLTLSQFVVEARAQGLLTGLAGSLRIEDIAPLAGLGADYLGFRGALCAGGRTGALDAARLAAVRTELHRAAQAARGADEHEGERDA
ncbi:(5-formylfuran-3-yl)methyl phosphate synthase [Ancylobacter sp. 6x-1]|uniref:(5-formylfuran-3-yl)methyl phosphate synthase n=1 Tax=Ancylobacter crimeensis TaxID=2579147 RepID=A0ABT0D8K2_9HYPH|nr:(5-formylfuran-3-yl)methyl phosphate synthase [Ancylobacter crimeensis]MCK0196291.1 (5-formylfuran-3-yl)methyl phosphate synthase [Ancylobacter crimeensis]